MLKLCGQIVNVYETESGKDSTGREYESKSKVQILTEGSRAELIDVKINDVKAFTERIGEAVEIAVKAVAVKSMIYYREVVV